MIDTGLWSDPSRWFQTSFNTRGGIYYIPNKYYAIAFPLWIAVTMFTVLQLYVAVCMLYTPDIQSYDTLQDKFSILKNPNVEEK
jgi:hypothetical protein